MRIGLISHEYPPQSGVGGVGTYYSRLAGALGRAGHQVTVLAGPSSGPESPQPNVTVHRISARYHPPLPWSGLRWLYWHMLCPNLDRSNPVIWHWLRWNMASRQALLEMAGDTPLDVIEAPEHAGNGLPAGRLGRWPLIVRIHGPWELFTPWNQPRGTVLNRLLIHLERQSTVHAQMLTTPSGAMARLIHDRWRPHRPLQVIPNFLDVPRAPLPPADGPPRIVCIGRLEPFKGQDVLVRAFAMVAGRHPRAELVLIGPDQWSPQQSFARMLPQLAPDRSVRRRIQLRGPCPLPEVHQELRHAVGAVIPSVGFESFSLSTLEAMAAARPIVAACTGAIPELLDAGRCGLLAPTGDSPAMAEQLNRLLADPALRQSLAMAAHQRACQHYDTPIVLPRILAAYVEAQDLWWTRFAGQAAWRRAGPFPLHAHSISPLPAQ